MGCVTSNGPVDVVPRRIQTPQKRAIAGVEFDFLTRLDVLSHILRWRRAAHKRYITLVNPHSVMTAHRNPAMRDALRGAGLCLPDGVGVVLAAKLLGYGRRHRVTGPTLMLELLDSGRAHGLRHFFYGGAEGVAERLREQFTASYPGLEVAGVYTPPFRNLSPAEDAAIVRRINRTRPDVVWVALGAPKQEVWMAAHCGAIDAAACIGVGAAFDFHSGNVKWAPRWIRKSGLEWAHRFFTAPRRMWRRNLDSPLFLFAIVRQWMKEKVGQRLVPSRATPSSPEPGAAPAASEHSVLPGRNLNSLVAD
jgi:N-acetylglucosaminyldiphosphoundecaprenol N-acetyl-beta-D-mannosaminyltransferase